MSSSSGRNVKWVEGLRGIASVAVVTTHVSRAWYYELFWPSDTPESAPRLLQLPILRVVAQGRIGVPIFAFLTGFVCAYKPLKLAYQQHNAPASLQSVARSAFRRPPRLVLPATIATFISFVLTLLGAYRSAVHCDSFWVRFDAPIQEPTFALEVRRLFSAMLTTWTNTDNPYDRHQWAMRPLLVGAFQVYICLAATIGMRFRYRILVHILMLIYWWLNREPLTETFGANLSLGTLLAELSLHRPTQNFLSSHHRILSLVVAPILIITGLYIGSYPQEHEDWSTWSQQLHNLFLNPDAPEGFRGSLLVPEGSDPLRRLSSLAIQMCAVAIFVSPVLRDALSHRILIWLGHHSFAVYLVHGTILRTVGMWIAYGVSGEPWTLAGINEDGSEQEQLWVLRRSRMHVFVAALAFLVLTYSAAWAWMRWVDSACASATVWLERKVFEDEDRHVAAEKGLGHVRAGHYAAANGNGSWRGVGSGDGFTGPGDISDKAKYPPP